jgi:hypothetical protein
MLQTYWFGLVALATLLTLGYLYRPRDRALVTSATAFVVWGLAAVLGGTVDVLLRDGSTAEAPVGVPIQLLALLLALLSLGVAVLCWQEEYPPEADKRASEVDMGGPPATPRPGDPDEYTQRPRRRSTSDD